MIPLCNTTASKWFHFSPEQVQLPEVQGCWPWTQANLTQWIYLATKVIAVNPLEQVEQLLILLICPLGVIGSVCSVVSLWYKAVTDKERFYRWMLVIAFLDVIFNVSYIPIALSHNNLFPNVYKYSYTGTELANGFPAGILRGCSFGADLCTLGLTAERYLSVCAPTWFQGVKKTIFTYFAVLIVLIGSSVRFVHSGLAYTAGEQGPDPTTGLMTYSGVTTAAYKSVWFGALQFFSDNLMPFILVFFMIICSIQIAVVVKKRSKARAGDTVMTERQQLLQQQSASMLRLLLVLVCSYFSNQIGYCLFSMSILYKNAKAVTFNSKYEDLVIYADALLFYDGSWVVRNIFECSSRSFNFYFYYFLSATVRDEFKKALGKTTGARTTTETSTKKLFHVNVKTNG